MHINYKDFTVVLPTLNEEKTIGKLIRYILSHYKGIHVLVVDDGSVDSTERRVKKISERHREIRFFDRHRLGLSRGLTASVIFGISRSKTRYAIVMDADLQHPPEILGELAKQLAHGTDLAVAVRASVPHWAFYRKLISKSLMLIGKIDLRARGRNTCKDIFSGFFGIRRQLFIETYAKNKDRFVGYGYKVLFDFLKCERKRIRISEVPYVFKTRKAGTSKAGIKQGLALLKSFVS
ncbi:MAG: glycosyltransferase [Candidatus Micrarchaeaceae archaeon]